MLALAVLASAFEARAVEVADGWMARRWGTRDGLPVESINAVLQGRDGYLWLATFDGLVRFDGARFVTFRSADDPELPSDRFTTMSQDEAGDLWLTTEQRHLVRFRRGRFTRFGRGNGLPDGRVESLHQDSEGTLWFGTLEGVARYRDGRMAPVEPERIRARVLSILHDPDGTLWLGTLSGGVLRLRDGDVTRFGAAEGLPSEAVEVLRRARDGALWAGTRRGVARLVGDRFRAVTGIDPVAAAVVDLEPLGDEGLIASGPNGLFQVRQGRLVVAAPAGGYSGSERLVLESPDGVLLNAGRALWLDGAPIFEGSSEIESFVRDDEGSLWVATAGDGLYRLRRSILETLGKEAGLTQENVYPVAEGPPGVFWVGSPKGGLFRIEDGVAETLGGEARGRPDHPVWTLLPDGDGGVWVGGTGVYRFDGSRFHRRGVDRRLEQAETRALFRGRDGRLWVGTYQSGLFAFDGASWQQWTERDGLPPAAIRVLAEDAAGRLWLGTNGAGAARFDGERFEVIDRRHGLPSDLVRTIHPDPDGVVWIGTENRGLVRVDARGRQLADARLTVFRKADGLFQDGLHQILDDGRGRLWMSTNQGIFSVARADLDAFAAGRLDRIESESLTEADGLRDREANGGVQSAGLRASDGRLWFPTQAGVVIVDPARVARNDIPPRTVIETLTARGPAGSRVLEAPSLAAAPVALATDERALDITYTGLSFVEPERVRFRYRLVGLGDDWIDAGTRRHAIFTNLPPGRYRFEVLAANEDGVWSESPASLVLVVPARFFETVWFQALVGATLLGLVLKVGLWRSRLQRRHRRALEVTVAERTRELGHEKERVQEALERLEEQAAELRELDEAKSRFFANVSHELRTPLTLILGPLTDAQRGATELLLEEVPAMRRNAQRLRRLIEQILDLQKAEAGALALEPTECDLVELARGSAEVFARLAERRGLELRFETEVDSSPALVDREKVERLLANLLSNAIKFSEVGDRVIVGVARGDGEARIGVRDTGEGIPAEALPRLFDRFYQVDETSTRAREGMGVGLALARELAALHGGRIEVESRIGEGSTFTVCLPLAESREPRSTEPQGRPATAIEEIDAELLLAPAPADPTRNDLEPDEGTTETRPRLLVVDDNEDLRVYLRRILQPRFEVLEAEDGRTGLAAAREALPDLVIADVMMPGMDGYALGHELAEEPSTAGIPFVFLTARAGESDLLAGFRSGAVGYVTKPFAAAELLARIDSLLAQQHRLQERLRAEAASEPPGEDPAGHGPFETSARAMIREHLHDERFDVGTLAEALHCSRPTLFRKLKEEAGIAPAELLRRMRLERAAELLGLGEGTVSEIAYAVGFDTLSGFSRAFKRHFGRPPSGHLRPASRGRFTAD